MLIKTSKRNIGIFLLVILYTLNNVKSINMAMFEQIQHKFIYDFLFLFRYANILKKKVKQGERCEMRSHSSKQEYHR